MKTRAFTLLELLVTMAIVAVLATLVFSAVSGAKRTGALAKEVNAGRQMIAGYLRAASDRDGELLIGYASREEAVDDLGKEVPNPANGRYPWRLAPYLEYKMRGILLVNEQEHIATLPDHDDFVYRASANPSFGINATFVGGNQRTGIMPTPATIRYYGNFVATRLSHVENPGKLLVFASARYTGEANAHGGKTGEAEAGYHLLTPPRTTKVEWAGKYDEDLPAENFGNLHFRYGGKAVCVTLGGTVEMLDDQQIQDMRYWSSQAAEANDPNYIIKPLKR